mgnify:CR=1 FL=1
MKKKLLLATIIAGTVISMTGCSNPFAKKTAETEPPLETQPQTEYSLLETENNYYEETDYAYTETEAVDTEDYSQSDQTIYNQANSETNQYHKKDDTFEVAITDSVTQKTVYANFTVDAMYSGTEADTAVSQYNSESTDLEIDTPTDGTEYKVIDFTLDTTGKDAPVTVSTDLICNVIGVNGISASDKTLYYNGATYTGGTVIYAKTETLAPGSTAHGSIVFCVPKGCTAYGIELGDNETVLVPENDTLVDQMNAQTSTDDVDMNTVYLD